MAKTWRNWDLNPSLFDSTSSNLNLDPEDLWGPICPISMESKEGGEVWAGLRDAQLPLAPLPHVPSLPIWAQLQLLQLREGSGPREHLSESG